MIPMYEPLEVSKYEKCGKLEAEPRRIHWKKGEFAEGKVFLA